MPPSINFNKLIDILRQRSGTFMMIGNGTKNQFKSVPALRKAIHSFLRTEVPMHSAFLYFGDAPNPSKPDIGYAFQILKELRPDIDIIMVQIDEAKSWGVPQFVSQVYWHKDYTKGCKWGGLDPKGAPCSNTKKWVSIAKRAGIDRILVLGGGAITLDELRIARSLKIPYTYVPLERKYSGDGQTKTSHTDTQKERIGVTYGQKSKN